MVRIVLFSGEFSMGGGCTSYSVNRVTFSCGMGGYWAEQLETVVAKHGLQRQYDALLLDTVSAETPGMKKAAETNAKAVLKTRAVVMHNLLQNMRPEKNAQTRLNTAARVLFAGTQNKADPIDEFGIDSDTLYDYTTATVKSPSLLRGFIDSLFAKGRLGEDVEKTASLSLNGMDSIKENMMLHAKKLAQLKFDNAA